MPQQPINSLVDAPTTTPAKQDWYQRVGSVLARLARQVASIFPGGTFNPTFSTGFVQYAGPNGTFAGNINFEFGTNLPNPSGTPGPALLLGSGYGATGSGSAGSFWVITDQAYDAATPGNNLGITAGETQPSGTANGGLLFLIGGGSFGGVGGTLQLQGGTSYNGQGGLAVLQGGNATQGLGIPGDAFVIGGELGNAGATVHLVCTNLNGSPGVVRIAVGSDITHTSIMVDFIPVGAPSAGSQPVGIYLYSGGGYGTAGAPLVSGGPSGGANWFSGGYTGSITFGTGHTMTVVNGLITGYS
jgi:hypothetical protein